LSSAGDRGEDAVAAIEAGQWRRLQQQAGAVDDVGGILELLGWLTFGAAVVVAGVVAVNMSGDGDFTTAARWRWAGSIALLGVPGLVLAGVGRSMRLFATYVLTYAGLHVDATLDGDDADDAT
jgi:hypothetical protein